MNKILDQDNLAPGPWRKNILFIVLSVALMGVNAVLVYFRLRSDVTIIAPGSFADGYVAGHYMSVALIPLMVVGLFQIGRKFRNTDMRIKIYFWTCVVILLSHLGNTVNNNFESYF